MDNFRRKNVRWAASGTLHEKTLQWISIQRWMRHSACEESLSATAPALIIATCVYFSQPTLCNCESDLLWNAAVSLRPADTRSCRLSTAGWNLLDSLKNCSWYDMFLLSVISRDQLLIFRHSTSQDAFLYKGWMDVRTGMQARGHIIYLLHGDHLIDVTKACWDDSSGCHEWRALM